MFKKLREKQAQAFVLLRETVQEAQQGDKKALVKAGLVAFAVPGGIPMLGGLLMLDAGKKLYRKHHVADIIDKKVLSAKEKLDKIVAMQKELQKELQKEARKEKS